MKKFMDFSASTGLVASPTKCNLYFGGVRALEQERVLQITGFVVGALLFKYLGVPLASRKLRHWRTRLLSYAAGSS